MKPPDGFPYICTSSQNPIRTKLGSSVGVRVSAEQSIFMMEILQAECESGVNCSSIVPRVVARFSRAQPCEFVRMIWLGMLTNRCCCFSDTAHQNFASLKYICAELEWPTCCCYSLRFFGIRVDAFSWTRFPSPISWHIFCQANLTRPLRGGHYFFCTRDVCLWLLLRYSTAKNGHRRSSLLPSFLFVRA